MPSRIWLYDGDMQVSSDTLADEVRLTVEAGFDIANAIRGDADAHQIHRLLIDHGFQSAVGASDLEIEEAYRSLRWLAGVVDGLIGAPLEDAVAAVNRALAGRAVAPSISSHDQMPLHIHWTSVEVPLGGRVVVDVLMALAQTLCDEGTSRFGLCEADGCGDVFYDATKNRSRRFCNDPRCASRTHTANHRARSRGNDSV